MKIDITNLELQKLMQECKRLNLAPHKIVKTLINEHLSTHFQKGLINDRDHNA